MNNLPSDEFATIVVGGALLALNAGFINAVSMSGVFAGVTVSHVTGSVSRISISLVSMDTDTLALVTSIIVSYMFGAFVGGFLVGDSRLVLSRTWFVTKLGTAMRCVSRLSFCWQATRVCDKSSCLASGAQPLRTRVLTKVWAAECTVQLVQRTGDAHHAHDGVRHRHCAVELTKGNILGQACRRDRCAETWRLRVHVPVLCGFLAGGVLGQLCWNSLREISMLVPSVFVGVMAATYLSLPLVKQAALRAKQLKIDSLLGARTKEDSGGPVNPNQKSYHDKLTTDMQSLEHSLE